jgi:hypothetical protein
VKPGDTILVHAGTYAYHYEFYANNTQVNATTTFEGTYYLTADGTAERPIVIKAAGDGEAIIDGRGNFNLLQRQGRRLQLLRGHHVQEHADCDLGGDAVDNRLERPTVKRCRFEDVGTGVFSNYLGRTTSTSPTACSWAA